MSEVIVSEKLKRRVSGIKKSLSSGLSADEAVTRKFLHSGKEKPGPKARVNKITAQALKAKEGFPADALFLPTFRHIFSFPRFNRQKMLLVIGLMVLSYFLSVFSASEVFYPLSNKSQTSFPQPGKRSC